MGMRKPSDADVPCLWRGFPRGCLPVVLPGLLLFGLMMGPAAAQPSSSPLSMENETTPLAPILLEEPIEQTTPPESSGTSALPTPSASPEASALPTRFEPFREEWRVSNDFTDLKEKDSSINFTFLQYIRPFAGRKGAVRTIVPIENVRLPDTRQFGVGDVINRVSYLPARGEKWGWLVGADVFWPTATDKHLGTEKLTIGPRTLFAIGLGKGWLCAPAYEYLYSYAGSENRPDIRLSRADFYIAWHAPDFKRWVILDPALFISHTRDHNIGSTIRMEYGQTISKGLSFYIRPGIGIGQSRPYHAGLEVGLRYFPHRSPNLSFF